MSIFLTLAAIDPFTGFPDDPYNLRNKHKSKSGKTKTSLFTPGIKRKPYTTSFLTMAKIAHRFRNGFVMPHPMALETWMDTQVTGEVRSSVLKHLTRKNLPFVMIVHVLCYLAKTPYFIEHQEIVSLKTIEKVHEKVLNPILVPDPAFVTVRVKLNNTFVTVTQFHNHEVFHVSSGMKIKGFNKKTTYYGRLATFQRAQKAVIRGRFKSVVIRFLSRTNAVIMNYVKGLFCAEFNVVALDYVFYPAHGSIRPKKKRRI